MTDLTDKWKKGELIEGKKYYCESKNIVDIFEAECCCKGQNDEWWKLKNEKYCFNNVYHKNDIKVLAPVPSCEEWHAKLEENTKLKELLKECIIYVDKYVAFSVVQGNKEREVESKELLTKINQSLGED